MSVWWHLLFSDLPVYRHLLFHDLALPLACKARIPFFQSNLFLFFFFFIFSLFLSFSLSLCLCLSLSVSVFLCLFLFHSLSLTPSTHFLSLIWTSPPPPCHFSYFSLFSLFLPFALFLSISDAPVRARFLALPLSLSLAFFFPLSLLRSWDFLLLRAPLLSYFL